VWCFHCLFLRPFYFWPLYCLSFLFWPYDTSIRGVERRLDYFSDPFSIGLFTILPWAGVINLMC
jgi:hypothetical protein